MKDASMEPLHKILFGVIAAVGIIVYAGFNIWVYRQATNGRPLLSRATMTPVPTPTPTPTPRAIPHGKKGFTVGQSDKTGPQLGRGFIDPYDPEKGTTQTVTIAVKYSQPVTKVTAVLKTDHAVSTPVPFTLTSGTNTDGQWQGSWKVTDSYLYTYGLVLEATSGTKTGSVEITLR